MKKIISVIAAFAMLSTMFVSTASAVITGNTVTITSDKETMTVADYADMTGSLISEDEYDAYKIIVSLSGIGDLTTDGVAKYSGRMISNLDYRLTFDNIENVDTSKDLYTEEGVIVANNYKWLDDDETTYAVSATDPYPGRRGDEYSDVLEGAFEIYVAVKKNTQVTATVTALMQIDTYSEKTPTEDGVETYNNVANFITLSPSTITLGSSSSGGEGPSEPDDGTGTEVKNGDDVIGTVWNDVLFEDVANTKYQLIFTDGTGATKPGKGGIDFGELSGDVTVAVILNSARTGVTLQVVPVTE